MSLRSNPVQKVNAKLAKALELDAGLRVSDIRRLIPKNRLPAGVMWELRRWGAEIIAIRKGRRVIGWKLKTPIPGLERRMDAPTIQTYVQFEPGMFVKPVTASKWKSKVAATKKKSSSKKAA